MTTTNRSQFEQDCEKRRAKNQYALAFPEAGDAWEDHAVYCKLVVVVIPKTWTHPMLIVVCEKKIEVDSSHWTWDISEKHKPFAVYTQSEYKAALSYKGMPDSTWADTCKGRFNQFLLEITDQQLTNAVKRWRKRRMKAMFPMVVECYRHTRETIGRWFLGEQYNVTKKK